MVQSKSKQVSLPISKSSKKMLENLSELWQSVGHFVISMGEFETKNPKEYEEFVQTISNSAKFRTMILNLPPDILGDAIKVILRMQEESYSLNKIFEMSAKQKEEYGKRLTETGKQLNVVIEKVKRHVSD